MSNPETSTMQYDNLFASQVMPVVSDTMTIAKSGLLKRGSVLTAAGALVTKTDTATDDVYAILAEDIDTTSAAGEAAVYLTGEFNASALTFGTGATAALMKESARKVGIFFKQSF
ncbi:head decoration protein [Turicimonas muris]|uniref:head decoration protein n=1 Tax=Turicimonas muris TaxID=1796652 RepID=UPI0023F43655|nr:head decoration protein [Turicimonas muris]